ncbi:hypothetical protein [Thermodesulfovibrio sp.]|uniref:hypothetical protein n=1 Tax=Thermodesulfovibrio sp. TaxID=2067987 RepID=UPI0030974ACA
MKVYMESPSECWINGKEYKVQAGIQEIPDEVAEVLINAGLARQVEEDKKTDKKK